MSTDSLEPQPTNYLTASYGVRSWLLTVDHKRIAILYLLSITFFFIIGGLAAVLIRLELLTPAGDLLHVFTIKATRRLVGVKEHRLLVIDAERKLVIVGAIDPRPAQILSYAACIAPPVPKT